MHTENGSDLAIDGKPHLRIFMGMSIEVAHLRKFEHILEESKFADSAPTREVLWVRMAMESNNFLGCYKNLHLSMDPMNGDCHPEVTWCKMKVEIPRLQGWAY